MDHKDYAIVILSVMLAALLGFSVRSAWTPPAGLHEPSTPTRTETASTPHKKAVRHVHNKTITKHRPVRQTHTVHNPPVTVTPVQQPRIVHAMNVWRQPRRSYTQDLTECKMMAQRAAGYVPEETIKGGLLGGAIGAAAGAAIGAVLGDPGKGAAIGAAAGGIGGGAYQGLSSKQRYKKAYSACMRSRGYNVLN